MIINTVQTRSKNQTKVLFEDDEKLEYKNE